MSNLSKEQIVIGHIFSTGETGDTRRFRIVAVGEFDFGCQGALYKGSEVGQGWSRENGVRYFFIEE